jgi:DNA-binding response OmpR family regulator
LIVEDHRALRIHIKELLWDFYRTELATHGKEGLELARKLIPDLIISDIMMPEMDGIEMCKQIKEDPKLKHIPVILLSAKGDLESKIKGFDTGADDYMEKPFSPQHLRSRVKNLIDCREELRTHFSSEEPKIPKKAGINHMDREFLEKVFQKIEQNIGNGKYNVTKLSEELGMTRVHLYRKFNELTGISPSDYMKETRLKTAAKLLEEGAYTISEVGFLVGFNSHSSFSVAFKAFYGVSPKEYKAG